jgi:glycosyltransferase involved in cell wall biosynthesis
MIKISIIIPVYKVEPYIVRCVESVLCQTYRNLEVILVDDCSPDRSIELAKECIERSPLSNALSFIFLRHEYNRGLSAARNTGLDAATGEYVYFLDSDDEITEDCITTLTTPIRGYPYDFVIGNYKTTGCDQVFPQLLINGRIEGVRKIAYSYSKEEWYCMAFNKLCNTDFLKRNQLYFKEGLIHEDELWSALLACSAETMCSIRNKATYIYHIRKHSITTNENYEQRIDCFCKVLKELYENQNKRRIYIKEIEGIEDKLIKHISYLMFLEGYSQYKIYKSLRSYDIRLWKTKIKMYNTLKTRILYGDNFLPITMGFYYKKVINRLLRCFYALKRS